MTTTARSRCPSRLSQVTRPTCSRHQPSVVRSSQSPEHRATGLSRERRLGRRPLIGMSGKDRAPRSCGDVDVELRRLTS